MLRSQALETPQLGFRELMAANLVEPDLFLHQSLPEPSPEEFSGTLLNLTWLCTKASQNLLRNLLRNPIEPDLALHQSLPDLLRNLIRNPVEPDLFLHQSLPKPSLSGTFSRNLLLNPVEPIWLCTKASQTFSGTFGTFSGTSLNLTRRLHQCTPELFWAEDPSSLRCWEIAYVVGGKSKNQFPTVPTMKFIKFPRGP